jgi:hypothetical protein
MTLQSLVVEYELANRFRELVTLPPTFESPCGLTLVLWCGGACGLDRIGSRTELVRGDVCDDCGLTGGVSGMPCCVPQVSRRAHGMAARRASLHHLDLATDPGAGHARSPGAAVGPQAEPTRRGRGRAPRKLPPTGRGDGDPNQ